MNTVTLSHKTDDNIPITATFDPQHGMNLVSYKRGQREVIDQNTRRDFENRFAGLGALIGPHFYRRNPEVIKPLKDPSLFPHMKFVEERGDPDPFTHGIGRYAPWTHQLEDSVLTGILKGSDKWNDISLSDLEGQNFTMRFQAKITPPSLCIDLSVVSDTDSIVGTHYYYSLPQGKGTVSSQVQPQYLDPHVKRDIPSDWLSDSTFLQFDLQNPCDYAFHPYPNPLQASILLDAIDYQLRVSYSCPSQENAWQLYHPKGASFVCIEPCSAQDPRHANLTVSSISIQIEILE